MANLRNYEGLNENSRKKILFDCDLCSKEIEQAFNVYCNQPGELKLCKSCRCKEVASRESVKKIVSRKGIYKWLNKDYAENTSKKIQSSIKEYWKNKRKLNWNIILQEFDRLKHLNFEILSNEEYWIENGKIVIKCLTCKNELILSKNRMNELKRCQNCK